MGGYGSTRWEYHRKKTLEENCLQLDILKFNERGLIAGTYARSKLSWENDYGEVYSTVGFEIHPINNQLYVFRLSYTADSDRESQDVSIDIRLTPTRPHFGGQRWWFVCPVVINDVPCNRRIRKLYLPPGEIYFGCRHCHRLTYRSAQEHDKSLDKYKDLSAAQIISALDTGDVKSQLLLIKALDKHITRMLHNEHS